LFEAAHAGEATWHATLRIPQQWNYHLRVDAGPARLMLDGKTILDVPAGVDSATTLVHLARGDHELELTGTAVPRTVEMARHEPGAPPTFVPLAPENVRASNGAAHGLVARVQVDGRLEQFRQDNTLATCCFSDLVQSGARPLRAHWQGGLRAPVAGEYAFRIVLPGAGRLLLDGATVAQITESTGGVAEARHMLTAGMHAVAIELNAPEGARGALELAWQRPDLAPETWSIIPHTFLTPALPDDPNAAQEILVSAPIADEHLHSRDAFPTDQPYETIR
jgi:hypothetical protein